MRLMVYNISDRNCTKNKSCTSVKIFTLDRIFLGHTFSFLPKGGLHLYVRRWFKPPPPLHINVEKVCNYGLIDRLKRQRRVFALLHRDYSPAATERNAMMTIYMYAYIQLNYVKTALRHSNRCFCWVKKYQRYFIDHELPRHTSRWKRHSVFTLL